MIVDADDHHIVHLHGDSPLPVDLSLGASSQKLTMCQLLVYDLV